MVVKVFKQACLLICITISTVCAQPWSFAVISDPLGLGFSYRKALREIRDGTVKPEGACKKSEFVVVNGDIGGMRSRMRFFRHVFPRYI